MGEVAVVSINTAKPGQEAALEAGMRALIAPTRLDRGFIQYDLHRDINDPRTFTFIERWESAEALDEHLNTPHIKAWRAKAGNIVESRVLQILEKLD